ncbi:hypothetical protein JW756_02215 [Candidatus Woesearchaeota archaeon]|nr:hypothetical protein [Candidatus Woesearchaeota archaeon]
MRIMNKKGIVQAVIDIGLAIIVVIIAMILFAIMTKLTENNKIKQGEKMMASALLENNIALYFKQPVEINGMKITMADFIVLIAETKNADYEKTWRGLTWNYFSRLGLNMYRLRVFVNKPNCNFNCNIFGGQLSNEFGIGSPGHTADLPKIDSITYLPSYNRMLEVEITYAPS